MRSSLSHAASRRALLTVAGAIGPIFQYARKLVAVERRLAHAAAPLPRHSMVARNARVSPSSLVHVHWRRAQSSVRGMRGQAGPRARNHAVQAARITAFAGVIILTRTLAARVAWVQHARHEAAINSCALLMAAGLHGPAGQLVHRPVVEAPARARVIAPAHHRSTVAKRALAKILR